jgi:hypothetical protein
MNVHLTSSTVFCDALDSLNSSAIELTESGLIKLWSDETFDHMALLMRALNIMLHSTDANEIPCDLQELRGAIALADKYNVSGLFHHYCRSCIIEYVKSRDSGHLMAAYCYGVELGKEEVVKHIVSLFEDVVPRPLGSWSMALIGLAGQRGHYLLAKGYRRSVDDMGGTTPTWRDVAKRYKLDPK